MNPQWLQEAKNLAPVLNRRINLQIPSILATDETFSLRIVVTGADGLPVENMSNRLVFEDSIGIEGLPVETRVDPATGSARIDGLRAVGPDVALVRARVETPDTPWIKAVVPSNPAWVLDDPPYRLYWGDLHVHTRYSNCHGWRCLDPEWCYLYAREISLLDFVAPADHLRGIASDPARWPRLQEIARQYNLPDEFVSFLAFESSHTQGFGGDNNVYFLEDDAPYFWLDRDDMRGASPKVHLRELWQQMDQTGKTWFTVPHHTGRAGKYRAWNEDYHDPQREPLFEIYSSWGSSEIRHSRMPISGGNNDDVSYFVDALKAGARFGVIGSSDDHATLPGSVHHFRTEPFRVPTMTGHAHKGLAAVRCGELTRPALFAAMRRRDCYATTHMRSLVDMNIGEASMGQELAADDGLRRQRDIRVRLTLHDAKAANVTLMRNGEPLAVESLRGDRVSDTVNEIRWTDHDPLERIALRDTPYHPEPFVVYYARIEDANGAHQWTSPIWIDL